MYFKDSHGIEWLSKFDFVKKAVGKRIRQIRESQDFTQANIADELGMEPGSYAKIERGEVDVQVTRLEDIAKILKVSIIDFFQDRKDMMLGERSGKEYGAVTKAEVEEIAHSIRLLRQEVHKVFNKIAPDKKRKSKRRRDA